MPSTRRPERVLISVAAAIVLALLGGYLTSIFAVPAVLRYVPLESSAFVVTAPLNELWRGLAPHLERYFKGPDDDVAKEQTMARRMGREIREKLDSKKIVLHRAEDMAAIGVDGSRQAAFAIMERAGTTHMLAVMPVLDRERFIKALEDLLGETRQTLEATPDPMLEFDGIVLSFGDDGTALLSDNSEVVRRALGESATRLSYFRSNDRLGRAFAASLPNTKGSQSAWLRGRVRLADLLPLGGEVYLAMAADDAALAVEGRMAITPARSQLVASLLQREPLPEFHNTLPRSDMALALNSAALTAQFQDLAAIPFIAGLEPLSGQFAPVFAELQGSASVQGLSVAVSDANQRVPGLVLGVRMDISEANALMLRLQTSLRIKRDREILRSAREIYAQKFGSNKLPPLQAYIDAGVFKNVQRPGLIFNRNDALIIAGVITDEPGALWSRYPYPQAGAITPADPDPPFTAQDFAGEDYVRAATGGGTLRFLMPPFTNNDLVHRFADKRDELKVDELKADRYRLCSIYHNGTLWIGNDGTILANWIERLRHAAPSSNFADAATLNPDAENAKVLTVVQPVRLFEAGQLYPDNDVNKMSRQWLADLAPYRSVLVGLSTDPQEQELYVRATFLRR